MKNLSIKALLASAGMALLVSQGIYLANAEAPSDVQPAASAAEQAQLLEPPVADDKGGLNSLRGRYELSETNPSEPLKAVPKDRRPYASDYIFQPPLIPHSIRNYEISSNANKCLSCHSFKRAVETGATKISVTHYQTREGKVLADVSPRRYFCLQCHVVQADADPLVENEFERVDSLQ